MTVSNSHTKMDGNVNTPYMRKQRYPSRHFSLVYVFLCHALTQRKIVMLYYIA